jgi:sulfonate transport system ATP-binding protein
MCQLRHVTKSYPLQQGVQHIFDDLTLQLPLEGITVLVGKSGCGKTTLLRLLANLEKPQQGEILFTRAQTPYQPKVGMVFQESRLLPWLTVAENIMLSQEKWRDEDVLPFLQLVDLDASHLHSKPDALSGGMAHRVAIARALAYRPDLLLLDEPFAALDYFTRMALQQTVIEIQQQTNTAVIFVTHNVDEALLLAKRILVLKKGEMPKSFRIEADYPRPLESAALVQQKKEMLALLL